MAAATATAAKRGTWRNKILILIVLLILATGGVFGYRAWNSYQAAKTGDRGVAQAGKADPGSGGGANTGSKVEVKSMLSLEPFLVNLADPQSMRFVKVTFQLGLTEDKDEFIRNPVAIAAARDAIITLLSSKTSDQILTVQGKEKLRREVREQVNGAVTGSKARVQNVYIVDFVVQL